jgi:antirestriction protein ArdC
LNREKGKAFGDKAYAFEELVAELGAAFLSASLGLPIADLQESSAAYLSSWILGLKASPRVLFTVASQAQQAVDFILKAGGVSEEQFPPDASATHEEVCLHMAALS